MVSFFTRENDLSVNEMEEIKTMLELQISEKTQKP
jgi:hypothetical protein